MGRGASLHRPFWFGVGLASACSGDARGRVWLEIPCASCALRDCIRIESLRVGIRSVVRFIGEIIGAFRTRRLLLA